VLESVNTTSYKGKNIMKTMLFELENTNTAQDKTHVLLVQIGEELEEQVKQLGLSLENGAKHTFYYDFDDGWACNVIMTVGTREEFDPIVTQSQGFLGYEWMATSILEYGRILKPELVLDAKQMLEQSITRQKITSKGKIVDIYVKSNSDNELKNEVFKPILKRLDSGEFNINILRFKEFTNKLLYFEEDSEETEMVFSTGIDSNLLKKAVEPTGYSLDQFLAWVSKNTDTHVK
jgi:hypothetical protein